MHFQPSKTKVIIQSNIALLLLCSVIAAACATKTANESSKNDPTEARAKVIARAEPSEEWTHYRKLLEAFTSGFTHEKQVRYNRWITGILVPFQESAWNKEWEDHPESHQAFAAFIRHQLKTQRHLRAFPELTDEKLSDKALFDNYLKIIKKLSEEDIQKHAEYEQELNIPNDLKLAASKPEVHNLLVQVYSHYLGILMSKRWDEERKAEQAAQIARRKAIVPVARDSKEYQSALEDYKKANEAVKAETEKAEKADPTLARARYWMQNERPGYSGNARRMENEFRDKLTDEQITVYDNWRTAFDTMSNREMLEKEWKEKPESHKAIVFILDALLQNQLRIAKEQNALTEDGKQFYDEWNKIDKNDVKRLFDYYLRHYVKEPDDLPTLEKELGITQKYKDDILKEEKDGCFFLIYETYARVKKPEAVAQAEDKRWECSRKLDDLRPNWGMEEKIERYLY